MTWRLVDMHCHLDRMANADEVARDAAADGLAIFDVPVAPADAVRARGQFSGASNVRVGVGLHPWWIADGTCGGVDIDRIASLAETSPFIGEVGLDFGRRGEGARTEQVRAFERIADAIAAHPEIPRVMSIHAVSSAFAVMDILEERGLVGATSAGNADRAPGRFIFHWFSGTSDELSRARKLGFYFSVSEHMLKSKRGREYARVIGEDRLLLETDAPPGLDAPYDARLITASLERAIAQVAELRHADSAELARRVAQTSVELLGLDAQAPPHAANSVNR